MPTDGLKSSKGDVTTSLFWRLRVSGFESIHSSDQSPVRLSAEVNRVSWKKCHDRLLASRNGTGWPFWVADVRKATQKRLSVSCSEAHRGCGVDGAKCTWDKIA